MKLNVILLLSTIVMLSSCQKSTDIEPIAPSEFVNEIFYTISRTGSTEVQSVKAASIHATYYHNIYEVLNKEGEKDILLDIQPEVPAEIDIVNRFSFSFLMSVPETLFKDAEIPSVGVLPMLTLKNPEDYIQILLDNDDENGRRVCLTREGENLDGSSFVDNACAGEGWYGDEGDFDFDITHHQLFMDEQNQAYVYVEGKFEAETPIIQGATDKFKLSDGEFKVLIPLLFE